MLNTISRVLAIVAGVLFLLIIAFTCHGVVRRYFLKIPEPYSLELSTVLLVWSFVLALPYVELGQGHIRADLLLQKLPENIKTQVYGRVTPFIGMIYLFLLAWRSTLNAWHSYVSMERSLSVLGEPIFPVKLPIGICYGVVCVILAHRFIANMRIRGLRERG